MSKSIKEGQSSSSNSESLSVSRKSKNSKGYKMSDMNYNNRDCYDQKALDNKRKQLKEESNNG